MEENLQTGLQNLLGGEYPSTESVPITFERPGSDPVTVVVPARLASQALTLYRDSQEHLRAGRWAEYGTTMDRLEQLLQQLERDLRGGGGDGS